MKQQFETLKDSNTLIFEVSAILPDTLNELILSLEDFAVKYYRIDITQLS